MTDIWGFLLQTLTASGVAALLLIVKALFRDKLPPKWQFAVWAVLAAVMLIPAGLGGRYVLLNWPMAVDLLRSGVFQDFTITRVTAPIPLPPARLPESLGQWVFLIYSAVAAGLFIRHMVSYFRLRRVLHRGASLSESQAAQLRSVRDRYSLPECRAVTLPGLPTAFVCGVLRPVLALPADTQLDDKVLLHELLHLKHRDTAWSFLICLLRCLHWCNPLIAYCAELAANDLEARCDQRVLELLEGEDRREYGGILLSMCSSRYTKTPGSTCMGCGGKNIRRRIEAIARFKKYPAGMRLVSLCILLVLALPLAMGVQASEVYDPGSRSIALSVASARTTWCTTYAGAFDAYAKAVLDQNGFYRILCTPESEQAALIQTLYDRQAEGQYPDWDPGLPAWPSTQNGYYLYNLLQTEQDVYEGLLVVELNYPPDGQPSEDGKLYLAIQRLRAYQEASRWVVTPLEPFQAVEVLQQDLRWGCLELSSAVYSGASEEHRVEVMIQTVNRMQQTLQTSDSFWGTSTYYGLTPLPHENFDYAACMQHIQYTHLGTQVQQKSVTHLGISMQPYALTAPRPTLSSPILQDGDRSFNAGFEETSWYTRTLRSGWGPNVLFDGGGSSGDIDLSLPEQYAADLYINKEKIAELTLLREGGTP